MACAWAGFAAYGISMVISYFVGQKYYPIKYPLRDIALYTVFAGVLFAIMTYANGNLATWAALSLNTVLIILFTAVIVKRDFPLGSLPVVGKYFRR